MTPRDIIKKIVRECIIIGAGLFAGILSAQFLSMETISWIALIVLGLVAVDWLREKRSDVEDTATTPQQDQTARSGADEYTELDLDTASIVNDVHGDDR